ncbi:MAG: hypothetical protein LAP87_14820 [Acidobacteriia bacterium]|nr:hypothetical protein [Terriglobia bacterium]
MQRTHRAIAAVTGIVLSGVVIHAFSAGPDPGYTGAPGDDPLACASCHTGTPLNGGGGNVVVNFPNGLTYSPGVQQTLSIVVTDSVARAYGFQMTARLESNLSGGQAGDFTAAGKEVVLCGNSFVSAPGRPCPANFPLEFIEHTQPSLSNTFSVLWTPPTTDVGNVHIYVAANAANLDGNDTGDHIYTADYVLSSQAHAGPPSIAGVQSASDFNPKAGVASGTWIEIYGSNFANTTRPFTLADFTGGGTVAPLSLDGVKVTVNGIPAAIAFVSPGQVNAQAPEDPTIGSVPVVITNPAGQASPPFTIQKVAVAPGLFAPAIFNVQGRQWAAAEFATGPLTFAGQPGLVSAFTFRLPKPGDVLSIFGGGFGPVTPATPAGTVTPALDATTSQVNFRFGQTPADVKYSGLAPGFVGLYQFNIVVPNVAPGDMQLNVDVGGVPLPQSLFITVGQ